MVAHPEGWAPSSVVEKFAVARLDWLIDLTDCLEIWFDIRMSEGRTVLAYANLGALVEGWLKLFYCAFYEDYKNAPKTDKKKGMIEPNNLSFDMLKQYSREILWDDQNSDMEKWVERIQKRRNAIHAFNPKDIGSPLEFIDDVEVYTKFVGMIASRLPTLDE